MKHENQLYYSIMDQGNVPDQTELAIATAYDHQSQTPLVPIRTREHTALQHNTMQSLSELTCPLEAGGVSVSEAARLSDPPLAIALVVFSGY